MSLGLDDGVMGMLDCEMEAVAPDGAQQFLKLLLLDCCLTLVADGTELSGLQVEHNANICIHFRQHPT